MSLANLIALSKADNAVLIDNQTSLIYLPKPANLTWPTQINTAFGVLRFGKNRLDLKAVIKKLGDCFFTAKTAHGDQIPSQVSV